MRELSGLELQGFIKERQAKQVRNLRQQYHIAPKLLIIMSDTASVVIQTYVRVKQRYADDILIDVEVLATAQHEMAAAIERANADASIHGIIVQLPLQDPSETVTLCNLIAPQKDVDGLGAAAMYPSATAEAIDWLLAGYNIGLAGKRITLLGHGKLVGAPLAVLWSSRGYQVTILDEDSDADTVSEVLRNSNVIVSATGVPRILKSADVSPGTIVIDAGTASEGGVVVGDAEESLRERNDITITPAKGGVGPLTYTLLFDHVIQAALKAAGRL